MDNFKKISENVGNLGTFDCYSILDEQNPFQNFFEEDLTVDKNILAVNKFKKYIKVSLKNSSINIYKKRQKLERTEILSDDLLAMESETYDDYIFLENQIVVMDFKMTIKNDLLFEVLNAMEQHQRDIIYMSLCENISDKKIGEKLKMSRSKVQRIKARLKEEIYNAMTGGGSDED